MKKVKMFWYYSEKQLKTMHEIGFDVMIAPNDQLYTEVASRPSKWDDAVVVMSAWCEPSLLNPKIGDSFKIIEIIK